MNESHAGAARVSKILFICTANVCRSPMAAAIFNALAEDKGLPFRAESAGVAALEDAPVDRSAKAALEEIGVYVGYHRARQVSKSMLEEAHLTLAMSPWHLAELRRLLGDLPHKIHTLPEYVNSASGEEEISDPRGQPITAYRTSVRQLLDYVGRLMKGLEP
jgi:protein-tyrosine phosphatase